MNMQAIPTVNDAIGGVPVTATKENLQFLPSSAEIGDTVLLKGNYARKFIVHRYGANDSERRARQSTYLKSFITAAKKALSSNPLLVVDILNKINDCSVTDLSVDECVWLASELLNMEIDTDFITLKGDEQLVDNQVVYTLDETFLYEMMLDIFYEEVE